MLDAAGVTEIVTFQRASTGIARSEIQLQIRDIRPITLFRG